jgi:hypothetical protein
MNLKKILKIIFLFLILSGSATGQQKSAPPKVDLKALYRENVDVTTKRLCVSRFTEPEGARVLAPFTSVSQMCECVRVETSYMVTDELAENLGLAQLDQGTFKDVTEAQAKQIFAEYGAKYNAAFKGCIEQAIRSRR